HTQSLRQVAHGERASASDWYLEGLSHRFRGQRSARPACAARILPIVARAGREGCMATVDRNEFLRGALAAGAASFASSVATNYTAHLEPSPAVHELANVVRLLDAASDRLIGALADARGIDPAVVAALENIKAKADMIAAHIETALPFG